MSNFDCEPSGRYRPEDLEERGFTAAELQMLAQATLAEFERRRRPVSEDSGPSLSKPKVRRRITMRSFMESLAIAGCAMAGVYAGVWLDSPDFDPDPVDTEARE